MRLALLVVLAGAAAHADPAPPDLIEATAELDLQSTNLHSTDGSLTAWGPRLELAADKRESWWSYGAFAALAHVGGDLAGTQYHIPITNGEYSVFGGVRLRGWATSHVFGAIGVGGVRIMSGGSEHGSPLLDVAIGVEPVRGGQWAARLVVGADVYAFDSISSTAWIGAAMVYRATL